MRTNQASATAYTVLQGIQIACQDPRLAALVGPQTLADQQLVMSASEDGRRRLAKAQSAKSRMLTRFAEWLLLPGITSHYVLRKQFVRLAVEAAVHDGASQVVIIGSGFDVLALGLHRNLPDVAFFEIDHPATNAAKRAALDGQMHETLTLIPADLSVHSLRDALLTGTAFDPSKPTVFVCEGVLMYLEPDVVDETLAALRTVAPLWARLVFSAVPPMQSVDSNAGILLRAYLRLLGEPLAWSARPSRIEGFLTPRGWRLLDQADSHEMQRRYLPHVQDAGRHRGEYMVLAEASKSPAE